jgi:hypothetical protein
MLHLIIGYLGLTANVEPVAGHYLPPPSSSSVVVLHHR